MPNNIPGNSTVCNADITVQAGETVQSGGAVQFQQTITSGAAASPYLIFNGAFVLEANSTATTLGGTNGQAGGILFQGDFTNNGSVTNSGGDIYLKWGTAAGTVSNTPIWNLCKETPTTTTTLVDHKICIKEIKGKAAIGEKLHAVIDGYGDLTMENGPTIAGNPNLVNVFPVRWGGASTSNFPNAINKTYEYTVLSEDIGGPILAKLTGWELDNGYKFLVVNGASVTSVVTADQTVKKTEDSVLREAIVYLGGANANDKNSGMSAEQAVATVQKAWGIVKTDGTGKIVVCGETSEASGIFNTIWKTPLTFTNTDGINTYSEAVLHLSALYPIYVKTDMTIEGVKLAGNDGSSTSTTYSRIFGLANGANLTLKNVTMDRAFRVQCAENPVGEDVNANITVINSDIVLNTLSNPAGNDYLTLNLQNSTVVSGFATTNGLAHVNFRDDSCLYTRQILFNITADDTNNVLLLDTIDNIPVPVTVKGTVTVGSKPIILKYNEATPAVNQIVLNGATENESLTASKFVLDSSNLRLVEDGDSIKTANKPSPVYKVTGITVSSSTDSVVEEQTLQMEAEVQPSYAINQAVTWSVENGTGEAAISDTGLLTAVKAGTVTVKATAKDGSGVVGIREITITAKEIKVEGITLNHTSLNLLLGHSAILEVSMVPSDATDKEVVWKSSDESVVVVSSDGTLTAVGIGSAVITCTAKDGSEMQAACAVTIKGTNTRVATLKAKAAENTIKVWWTKVSNASGYEVYGGKCGEIARLLNTISGRSNNSWLVENVEKGTNYKFTVKAYKIVAGNKIYIKTTNAVHLATLGGKYTNARAVITDFQNVELSVGDTQQITAKLTKLNNSKKMLLHLAEFRYVTSDKSVARVSKSGKITAIGKGTCFIYVYANNGVNKKLSITVK